MIDIMIGKSFKKQRIQISNVNDKSKVLVASRLTGTLRLRKYTSQSDQENHYSG